MNRKVLHEKPTKLQDFYLGLFYLFVKHWGRVPSIKEMASMLDCSKFAVSRYRMMLRDYIYEGGLTKKGRKYLYYDPTSIFRGCEVTQIIGKIGHIDHSRVCWCNSDESKEE